MVLSGLLAACFVWAFRHIILQSFWETGEGWKESLYGTPAVKKAR